MTAAEPEASEPPAAFQPPEAPEPKRAAPLKVAEVPTEATGGGAGKFLVLLGLLAAAGAGVYFLSQSPKRAARELPPPLPSASTTAPSQVEPQDAGADAADGDAAETGERVSPGWLRRAV